jgi:hypothetical protein
VPSTPISFSDSEIDQVLAACRPLEPRLRDAFVQAVASALTGCSERGPGLLHRTIAMVQRRFWDPPIGTIAAAMPRPHGKPRIKGERARRRQTRRA